MLHKIWNQVICTYNKRQTQQMTIMYNTMHRLSLLSRCSCCKSPPHFLQHTRQQHKQIPTTMKMIANTGPKTVTTRIGVHHSPNYRKKQIDAKSITIYLLKEKLYKLKYFSYTIVPYYAL